MRRTRPIRPAANATVPMQRNNALHAAELRNPCLPTRAPLVSPLPREQKTSDLVLTRLVPQKTHSAGQDAMPVLAVRP